MVLIELCYISVEDIAQLHRQDRSYQRGDQREISPRTTNVVLAALESDSSPVSGPMARGYTETKLCIFIAL